MGASSINPLVYVCGSPASRTGTDVDRLDDCSGTHPPPDRSLGRVNELGYGFGREHLSCLISHWKTLSMASRVTAVFRRSKRRSRLSMYGIASESSEWHCIVTHHELRYNTYVTHSGQPLEFLDGQEEINSQENHR
jgi:hypothetical protein